jgi:hypothetical protein
MSHPSASVTPVATDGPAARVMASAGLLGLMVITLASPGATRMYAWPWVLAYWVALLAPVALLVRRGLDIRQPWALPGRGWSTLTLAWCGLVLASALASPYRGPALLWSAPLLSAPALFLVVFDWLHRAPDTVAARTRQLWLIAGLFLGMVALTSLGFWLSDVVQHPDWATVWQARNPYPLGHANYTAGLALLMLPCFGGLAFTSSGRIRVAFSAAAVLALTLLFGSGSRGGFAGLVVVVLAAVPAIARRLGVKLWWVSALGLAACLLLVAANPRVRQLIAGTDLDGPVNASDQQRRAMITAGGRLGAERPLLGWGPGTTPLAYPRVRAGLEGGAEDVLQLHSLPVQLWAELGAGGGLVALAALVLALSAFRRTGPVLLGLGGYLLFSLTDWQLDVPVFAAAAAIGCALVAGPGPLAKAGSHRAAVFVPAAVVVLCALLGRTDPTPGLNLRALTLARDPARGDQAIALLRESLGQNPDQEIAHFNLGWLLVVRDAPAAEREFLAAARLVPDKGGVWFGLGLARLNQGNEAGAARAFALEGLNDPAFLFSPWWKVELFAKLRRDQAAEFTRVADAAAGSLQAPDGWLARESRYVAALTRWSLDRARVPAPEVNGPVRAAYFARDPRGAELDSATIKAYRRERTGYPVLMRQPDLPPPSDLFDVQENAAATGPLRFLFPEKGWLPSPLLLELADRNF